MHMETVTKAFVKKLFPRRPAWSHKGDFGKLLIIAGSRRYTGSPALCGLAALRAGVDLVTIAAPQRAADTAASFSPDLITEPLRGDCFNPWHLKTVLETAKGADAVVIGGGMGRRNETIHAVLNFLKNTNLPCVVDADAIHFLAERKEILPGKDFVLTPPPKEFFALAGEHPGTEPKKRAELVKKHAKKLEAVILLKGHTDVISDGRKTMLNKTGSPYLTKGGTGETVTGICGALLARGVGSLEAACAAAYINGAAGELASKQYGPGMLASDLLGKIPEIIKK